MPGQPVDQQRRETLPGQRRGRLQDVTAYERPEVVEQRCDVRPGGRAELLEQGDARRAAGRRVRIDEAGAQRIQSGAARGAVRGHQNEAVAQGLGGHEAHVRVVVSQLTDERRRAEAAGRVGAEAQRPDHVDAHGDRRIVDHLQQVAGGPLGLLAAERARRLRADARVVVVLVQGGHEDDLIRRVDLLQGVEHLPSHVGVRIVVPLEQPSQRGRVRQPPERDRARRPQQRDVAAQERHHPWRAALVAQFAQRLECELHRFAIRIVERLFERLACGAITDLPERERRLAPHGRRRVGQQRQQICDRGRILKPPDREHGARTGLGVLVRQVAAQDAVVPLAPVFGDRDRAPVRGRDGGVHRAGQARHAGEPRRERDRRGARTPQSVRPGRGGGGMKWTGVRWTRRGPFDRHDSLLARLSTDRPPRAGPSPAQRGTHRLGPSRGAGPAPRSGAPDRAAVRASRSPTRACRAAAA